MKKLGRKPSLRVTKENLQKIEKMSGLGMTQIQIAGYFGISHTTWHKLKKKNKKLKIIFNKGKSEAVAMVAGRLMQQINNGNLTAILFYLKTQAGWKENSTLEIETKVKSKKSDYKLDTTDAIEASKIYQSIMTGSYKR